MKIPWVSVAAAVAGLMAGIGISGFTEEKDGGGEPAQEHARSKSSPVRSLASRSEPHHSAGPGPATGGHRLEDLFTLDWGRLNLDETNRRLLNADAPTLKEWVAGLLEKEEQQGRSLPVLNLRNRVIRELYRREGIGLLAWAESSGSPEVMAQCLKWLGRDDVMAAVANIGRFKSLLQEANIAEGWAKIELMGLLGDLREAVMFQDQAVIGEFHRVLGADLKGCHDVHSLPENFDHAAFLHSLEPSQLGGVGEVVQSWAIRDRDAAWDLARTFDATAPPYTTMLTSRVFDAVVLFEGEEEAVRWLSDELADASVDERTRILGGLFPYQRPSPDAYATILNGLPNERDAAAFREAMKRRFPKVGP